MSRALALCLGAAVVGALGFLVARAVPGPDYPAVRLDPGRPRPQGDFYRSAVPEPPSLNPFTTRDAVATRYVLRYTHDTLVDIDPLTGELRPALAESWRVSDDGRTWTFRLRENLRFSDGAPVTVEDLRFTLAVPHTLDAASQSAMSQTIAELARAEAPDARTVVLELDEPRARALRTLGTVIGVAQRRFFVDAVRELDPDAGHVNSAAFAARLAELTRPGPGTGPYQLHAWHATHLDLVQNPHSWRRGAYPEAWNLAGLRLAFLTDEATKFAALRNQEIDWFVSGSGGDLAALVADDPGLARHFAVHAYDNPAIGSYYVMWNHRRDVLADPRVRRALSMLFDREAIAARVFGGNAVPSHDWFADGAPESAPDVEPWPHSPSLARELLAEAGFGPDGETLRLEILCAAEIPALRRIIELAQPEFRAVGVDLSAQTLDYGSVYTRQTRGEFDAVVLLDYRDSTNDPHDFFASSENLMGWRSAAADELLTRARAQSEDAARRETYREFERLLHAEEPVTFLVHPLVEVALHRRFREAEPGPLGLVPERWWVPAEEQLVRVSAR